MGGSILFEMVEYTANIWKLYLFRFLLSLHFIGGILIPFFTDWGGMNLFQIMVLQAVFVFAVFLFEVPTGAIADNLGRKYSLMLSGITFTLATLIYISTPHFWVFFMGEVMWGFSVALFSGALEAIVFDTLKVLKRVKDSKKIFGRFHSFDVLGLLVSSPIGSYVASVYSLRIAFSLMIIPSILAFFLTFFLDEPPRKKIVGKDAYLKTLKKGVLYFKNHPALKVLALDRILVGVICFFAIWFWQVKFTNLDIPLVYFGLFHALFVGMEIPVSMNFSFLERIFGGKKLYLFWSTIIAGIGFLVAGLTSNVVLVTLGFILVFAFGLTRFVLFLHYFNKHTPSSVRATVLSTINMMDALIRGSFYLLMGIVLEYSLTAALVSAGGLLMVIALVSKVKEEHLLD